MTELTTGDRQYYCNSCKTMHDGTPYITYRYYGVMKHYCDKFYFPTSTMIV